MRQFITDYSLFMPLFLGCQCTICGRLIFDCGFLLYVGSRSPSKWQYWYSTVDFSCTLTVYRPVSGNTVVPSPLTACSTPDLQQGFVSSVLSWPPYSPDLAATAFLVLRLQRRNILGHRGPEMNRAAEYYALSLEAFDNFFAVVIFENSFNSSKTVWRKINHLTSVDWGVLRRRVFRTLTILLVRISSLTFLLHLLLTLEIETDRQTMQRYMRPQLKKSQFSSHLIGKR